jgi:hypothetical protein
MSKLWQLWRAAAVVRQAASSTGRASARAAAAEPPRGRPGAPAPPDYELAYLGRPAVAVQLTVRLGAAAVAAGPGACEVAARGRRVRVRALGHAPLEVGAALGVRCAGAGVAAELDAAARVLRVRMPLCTYAEQLEQARWPRRCHEAGWRGQAGSVRRRGLSLAALSPGAGAAAKCLCRARGERAVAGQGLHRTRRTAGSCSE